jgi:molybdopterin molybdotransferase
VQAALKAEGTDMAFWKIALRPGKPMMHGKLGPMRVLGLPGNPVSSYICAYLFLVPLIRALSGRTQIDHVFEQATLGRELPANDQRQDYLRARLDAGGDGLPIATSVGAQDSSLVANLAAAQALIVRPPFVPAAPAGSTCTILRLPN